MIPNPITDEIRAIRHQLAAEQGNDVFRIGNEMRRNQTESGRRIVKLPARSPEINTTNQTLKTSRGPGVSNLDTSSPAVG
jgi:hypothetical protein